MNQKWKKLFSREYGVQYTEISLRALSPEMRKLCPYPLYNQIYVPEESNEVCYIGENDFSKLIRAMENRRYERSIKNFERLFMNAAKEYLNFSKKISKQNLKDKNNAFLKKLYLKYQKLAVRYTLFIWLVYYLNEIFSEKTRNIIKKSLKDTEEEKLAIHVLFSPAKKATILKFTEDAKNLEQINDKTVAKLYKKYNWISCLDLHDEPWTIKEFVKHVKIVNKKTKKELINYNEFLYKLKLKKQEKILFKIVRTLVYLKDLRDDFRRQAIYYIRASLFKEIANRMGISLRDISYLQEKEIIEFLDNNVQSAKFRERQKGFIIFFNEKKHLICKSGNDLEKAIQMLGFTKDEHKLAEITGLPASKGIVRGKVAIVKGAKDLRKVKKNNILVAVTTHPDYVPAMQKAAAIVTDEGGITSHAAIVSRELKKPCIVGTKTATKTLKDADIVEVDANNGIVRKIS